jgi:hypothetical protein
MDSGEDSRYKLDDFELYTYSFPRSARECFFGRSVSSSSDHAVWRQRVAERPAGRSHAERGYETNK